MNDDIEFIDEVQPTPQRSTPDAPFNSTQWLNILAGQVGVRMNEIPNEVLDSCKLKRSKTGVNEAFFAWYTNRPPLPDMPFSPEDAHLFKTLIGLDGHPDYVKAKRQEKSFIDLALDHSRNAQTYLERAGEERMKAMRLANEPGKDLTDEVKRIMLDGWWRFDSRLTHTRSNTDDNKTLVFVSPKVMLKFYNVSAGIDMDIDMGSYLAELTPTKNKLVFKGHEDNVMVNGHIHPHIAGSGNMCWGNAADTMTQGFANLEYAPMMSAARVILTQYNESSPYVNAERFFAKRHGEERYTYVPSRQVYLHTNDRDSDIHDDSVLETSEYRTNPNDISDDPDEHEVDLVQLYARHLDGQPADADYYTMEFETDGAGDITGARYQQWRNPENIEGFAWWV